MSIVLIFGKNGAATVLSQHWQNALKEIAPEMDIELYPNVKNAEKIEFAICWSQPKGVFNEFKNLKCISSLGAGVNHILADKSIKPDIKIVRVIENQLTRDMTHYAIQSVLNITRMQQRFIDAQKNKIWDQKTPFNLTDQITVGVMGLGAIGKSILEALHYLQIKTIGFSKNKKDIKGIKTYAENEFSQFLNQSNILLSVLPLTPETTGIINKNTIRQLPKNAYIINIGRGSQIIDDDLLDALNNNHLSGAKLDVFHQEPLPESHPFWQHPKIDITPHNASVSNPKIVAKHIIENYYRLKNNQELVNLVNRNSGY